MAEQEDIEETVFLTKGAQPSAFICREYASISKQIRPEMTKLVGQLGGQFEDSLDWWLEGTASRKETYTELYHQVVVLLLIQRLVKAGQCPKNIVVDTKMVAIAARKILRELNQNSMISVSVKKRVLFSSLKNSLSPLRSIVRLLVEWSVIRMGRRQTQKDNNRSQPLGLILIDTFVLASVEETDRYYPGLYENAGSDQIRIRFVPQFYGYSIAALATAAQKYREKENYIIKEDSLGIRDMLWCFGHLFRKPSTLKQKVIFNQIDISDLVQDDMRQSKGFRCALRGLINYRFAKALKRSGLRVAKTIDWFENQPMDKGWNAGFNTFYPNAKRVGYTGFYTADLSFKPTVHEYNAKLLPQQQLVIGEGFQQDMAQFFTDCNVATAPAFRYQSLPELKKQTPQENLIFVPMSFYEETCRQMLTLIIGLQKKHPKWRFVIKPHPARPLDQFTETRQALSNGAEITGHSIQQWLPQTKVMLTEAQSSAILESTACAVPTIVIRPKTYSMASEIPKILPQALYELCDTPEATERSIIHFLKNENDAPKKIFEMALTLRAQCFVPVNRVTVREMLAA